MSSPAVLVATVRVRKGKDAEFAAWKARLDTVIGKFPGYVSSDVMPGANGSNQWTIVINFRSADDLAAWRQSKERSAIVAEGTPLLEDGNFSEVAQVGEAGVQPVGDVTEVIFSRIKPGMEDAYREWTTRIEAAQAAIPAIVACFSSLQTKRGACGLRSFASKARRSSRRGWTLRNARVYCRSRRLLLSTSNSHVWRQPFPDGCRLIPITGKGPPNWKTAMLVLLGLFPVVMLELRFLSPILTALGLHASLATFIGNSLSVAATSFITMPLFVRWFGWWLFPDDASTFRVTSKGVAILVALYALEVAALWQLLPW